MGQTKAALAQRACPQECEPAAAPEAPATDPAASEAELTATSAGETEDASPLCECDAITEAEELELVTAAWAETSSQCQPHAQVLARRTRSERQRAQAADRQGDWSEAPPIDEYDRQKWELEKQHAAEMAELEAELEALKDQSTPGELEVRERMGKKTVVLSNLVVPVMREPDELVRVYTVELRVAASKGSVEAGISPWFRLSSKEWSWLKCHDAGLWKDQPWASGASVEGNDGHWIHLDVNYQGDVREDGKLDEWVMFTLPEDVARELVAAEHSGAQVCQSKFELSAEQKASIEALLDHPDA